MIDGVIDDGVIAIEVAVPYCSCKVDGSSDAVSFSVCSGRKLVHVFVLVCDHHMH